MLKLRKVAVTGGLSCGKSSVCRILKELGAYVISADLIVHHLLSSDTNLGQKIVKLLGSEIIVNKKIERSKIATLVFQDIKLLEAFEKLVHPLVYKEIDQEYNRQSKQLTTPPSLFVAEVPLLFESSGESNFDASITVVANQDVCLDRFTKTTGYDQNEYYKRMARQYSLSEKTRLADYTIVNNGTLPDLRQETLELYKKLMELKGVG